MQKLKVKNLKSKNTKVNLKIIIIIKTTFASPDRNFRTAHVSNFRKWYFFNRKSPSQVLPKCTLSFLERFPFYIVIKLGKMTKNGRDKQQVFGFYEKS